MCSRVANYIPKSENFPNFNFDFCMIWFSKKNWREYLGKEEISTSKFMFSLLFVPLVLLKWPSALHILNWIEFMRRYFWLNVAEFHYTESRLSYQRNFTKSLKQSEEKQMTIQGRVKWAKRKKKQWTRFHRVRCSVHQVVSQLVVS